MLSLDEDSNLSETNKTKSFGPNSIKTTFSVKFGKPIYTSNFCFMSKNGKI